jgi:hypothetical protein
LSNGGNVDVKAAVAAAGEFLTFCRRLFGLAPATSFHNITPDATLAATLEQLYGGQINNVDAYVGGLAEPHFGNAHVGQLFYTSIFDQFQRLRDGDWYFFKNADNGLFNAQEVAEIESTGRLCARLCACIVAYAHMNAASCSPVLHAACLASPAVAPTYLARLSLPLLLVLLC